MGCYVGASLSFTLERFFGAFHERAFVSVVPVDVAQLAWVVGLQWSIPSRWIGMLVILCWQIDIIVGRFRLLAASLGLVVTPIPSLVISALSLLVVGGRLVGMILLRKHLSQRC